MPSPFESAGANHQGSDYAPLITDEYFTGLVTNRSALRDASVPYNQRRAYAATGRFDSIWDGLNTEVSAKLTLIKRFGSSVYNSQLFPAVGRFYDFRTQVDGLDVIRVMVDAAPAVYDGTGPNGKTLIWNKSIGAGKTSFLSVGNTLYMGNGVDQIKWTVPTHSYKPSTSYSTGQFVVDPQNGNIQVAFGAVAAQIVSSSISNAPHAIGFPVTACIVTLQLAPAVAPFGADEPVTFSGLTAAAILNGKTYQVRTLPGGVIKVTVPLTPTYVTTTDGGIAYSNADSNISGVTAAVAPAFASALNAATVDGGVVWICKGTPIQKWGIDAPTLAPTVNQTRANEPYPQWAANTFYFPQQIIVDPTGLLLIQLFQPGVTAAVPPVFSSTVGHATVDGTAQWITVYNGPTPLNSWPIGPAFEGNFCTATVGITSYVFRCILSGTPGGTEPAFNAAIGSLTNDGDVIWQNVGPLFDYATIGSSQAVEVATTILDPAGYLQAVTIAGISGAVAPMWNDTGSGYVTIDNAITWTNGGAFATAATATAVYAYSFRSSWTGAESSVSPLSLGVLIQALRNGVVLGSGSTDTQVDQIAIYRTPMGGSTLLLAGYLPLVAPGSSAPWVFLDTATDKQLNIEIQGAINGTNAPPPAGLINLSYHMGRIWGSVGTLLYFCTGPAATAGNGNEAWSASNVFAMPDAVARTVPWDLPNGVLLVFTAGDPFAIWGTGTVAPQIPFYNKPFTQGGGLLSYDALEAKAGWISMFTTDMRLLVFQPNASYTPGNPASDDAGVPIGDQFIKVTTGGISSKLYTPAGTYLTFHSAGTNDTGLFVADGKVGWFRFCQVSQPETGNLWNPRAAIVGGTSAVRSTETSPGVKQLLIGPAQAPDQNLLVTDIVIAVGFASISHSNLFLPIVNTPITLTGLTTVPALNGKTVYVTGASSGHFEFSTTEPDQVLASETGIAEVPGAYAASGPILYRDPSVNSDNGANYGEGKAYSTIGSIQLCQPSEEAEIAEIMLDSIRTGTAPTVAVLLGEINPTAEVPFVELERTSPDPPLLANSQTLFNDRFATLQNGQPQLCRHMQVKIEFANEDAPNETLTHTIYGRVSRERQIPAA